MIQNAYGVLDSIFREVLSDFYVCRTNFEFSCLDESWRVCGRLRGAKLEVHYQATHLGTGTDIKGVCPSACTENEIYAQQLERARHR